MPWGRWTEHDGGGIPDGVRGRRVKVKFIDGLERDAIAGARCTLSGGSWNWDNCPIVVPIIRYRIWSDPLPSFDVTESEREDELA